MFRVEKEIKFCYGHRLINYNGKCANLHGHNGRAIIVIESPTLDTRGMAMDFSDIKLHISKWIDDHLDHQMLLHREDPIVAAMQEFAQPCFLMDENPTAENIAKLTEVRLWETDTSVATYRALD